MTSWVALRHPAYRHLGGSLGGGSFVVKVDIDRNRISAGENTRFTLLYPEPFSQHEIFLEFEFSAHN